MAFLQMTPPASPFFPVKSKTLATWAAFGGGFMGWHRFYLHGLTDPWGWLHAALSALGLWGLQRVSEIGQDDRLAWLLLPLLGMSVAAAMLQAIVHGLSPDERWHAQHNPTLSLPQRPGPSGWPVVIGVVLALLVGGTVLMSTIAFSAQRYFESQVIEGLKMSQ